jgi:hypothetical protein
MAGRREALIVAIDAYEHAGLRRLRSAAADADALAGVLGDPDVGAFDVQVVRNEPAYVVEARIEDLFADAKPDDVVLVHFSGHGLKGEAGDLFFAATNTRPDRLASTAVPADFVQRCMRASRSRSVVLLLDCCYGGAFSQGVTVRAAGDVNVLENFPTGRAGGGRGRAVITASSAMEYAFEGDRLADDGPARPSVFTSALVDGLTTGEADRDEDGWVSLSELYDYVFDRVREQNPNQTPSRDIEMQGDLYLARSRRRRVVPADLPPDLRTAMADPNPYTRLGAVSELAVRLLSENEAVALGARQSLTAIAQQDTRLVAEAAAAALREEPSTPPAPRRTPSDAPARPPLEDDLASGTGGVAASMAPPTTRPAAAASHPRPGERDIRRLVAGWLALLAAAVLLVLPPPEPDAGSGRLWAESLLPLVALAGSASVLWLPRLRAAGAGLVLGAAAAATWVAVTLAALMTAQGALVAGRRGVLALVALLVLVAAGAGLAPDARRTAGRAADRAPDRAAGPGRGAVAVIAGAGVAGGLGALANGILLLSATAGGSSWDWMRLPALWAVLPALAAPLLSLRLGTQGRSGLLAGWALAGGGFALAFGDAQSVAALDMSFAGLVVLLLSLVVLLVIGLATALQHRTGDAVNAT